MSRRYYSDAQRAEALAALEANDGNVAATSRQTGISTSTLRGWRDAPDRAAPTELRAEKKAGLADRLEALAHDLIDDLAKPERRRGNVKDVATAIGIAVDKARLLRGESTEITETRSVEHIRDDIQRKLARLAATN
ncbi:MAG: transposase [Bacteroidota bacterium]